MIRLATTTLAAVAIAGASLAAGSSSSTPPKPTETTQECTDGKVWDAEKNECVVPEESSLNDDQRYDAVREFAYAGQYKDALRVLAAADNPNDPRMLNYKGFVNRKLGHLDVAMEYYVRALEIDPDYVLARSYYGQALAETGDMEGARDQLLEIRARGGRDSWAYASLKQRLSGKIGY